MILVALERLDNDISSIGKIGLMILVALERLDNDISSIRKIGQ